MQSYLEEMGRQLAEIQAQHQQFYASRPERNGRVAALRSQEHGYRAQRSSSAGSASGGTPAQRAGEDLPEGHRHQGLLQPGDAQDLHTSDHASTSPRCYRGGTRSSSASGCQSGARRSLVFFDSPVAEPSPVGQPRGTGGNRLGGLRSSSSTPLPLNLSVSSTDGGYSQTTTVGASPASRHQSRGQALGADQSPLPSSQDPSVGPSLSPSSASVRPYDSNPVTPSVSASTALTVTSTPYSAAPPSVARPGTASTSGRSGPGAYGVYDATGQAVSPHSTPATDDPDRPLMASVRSSSQAATHGARRRRPHGAAFSSPRARQVLAYGALPEVTPSTGSVRSSAIAVHCHNPDEDGEATSEGEAVPYPLALAGQAFDGIDSEEDEEHASGTPVSAEKAELYSAPQASAAESGIAGASPNSSRRSGRPSSSRAGHAGPIYLHGDGPSRLAQHSAADSRESSRPPSRAPLQAASLETEEALRALLASTHFRDNIRASVGASIDAEGADVPDDVLTALASTNPAGLDALLGAATPLLRERGDATNPSQPGTQSGGEAGRRPALGPGSLTAAPAAPPASLTARGAEALLRAAGSSRHYSSAAGASPAAARMHAPVGSPRNQRRQMAAVPSVDASLDASEVDLLSRTLEVRADGGLLPSVDLRGSVASSAAAMAMQMAAAQAHAQPVLYTRASPRPSASTIGDAAEPLAGDEGQPSGACKGPSSWAVADGTEHPASPDASSTASLGTLPRGRGAAPSPSAVSSRQGGDGDMVLYGSPRRCNNNPSEAAPPPSAAASPYVPPSPPPGADPTPYMASPTVCHPGSRLQRNSRDPEASAYGGPGQDGDPDATFLAGQGRKVGELVSSAGGTGGGNSGSRCFSAKAQSSLATSGATSLSFDLSLTQAAAAGGSGRTAGSFAQLPATASVSSSAGSLQRLPTSGLGAIGQASPSQPVYSTFSVVGIAPGAHAPRQVASHDLEANDARRPMSPTSSSVAGVALVSAQAGAVAPSSAGGGRAGSLPPQQPPAGLPLAAFSRAAALAAAADVGLKAPPLPVAGARRPSSAAAAPPAAAVAPADSAGASPGGSGANAAAVFDARAAAEDGHLAPGQSPVPPFASSSAAKLVQLKARRQQQWTSSQPGAHGQAAEHAATTLGAVVHQGHDRLHGQEAPGSPPNRAGGHGNTVSGDRPSLDKSGQLASGGGASVADRHQASPAAAPTLIPGSVAEAIARASHGGMQLAASGELNLGHGISGLSVAIEAGQVKWAWQTGQKDSPRPGQADNGARLAASPGASDSSPWASPVGEQRAAAAGDDTDWAQLPLPQWQRHGQLPAGGVAAGEEAELPKGRPQLQQNSPYGVQRRHSEYSLPSGSDRQAASVAEAQAAPPHQFAATTGQEPQPLRGVVSADVGGKANNKALALMRLKRQSIMRHAALAGGKEVEVQPADHNAGEEPLPPSSLPPPVPVPRQQPRNANAPAQRAPLQQEQQQRLRAAVRVQPVDPGRDVPRAREQQGDVPDASAGDVDGPPVQPKPFLRRRSAKIEAKKVDWSHVKPRTNTRNADYYADRSPRGRDAIFKKNASPVTSPNGAGKPPPLNVNNGGRAWKPSGRLPQTPTEEEKVAAILAAKRPMSNIPAAPGYGGLYHAAPRTAAENRIPGGQRAAGAARGPDGAMSPLDDLLAHVNTLLRDFDKIVL